VDFAAQGLLDDLEGDARTGREQLLNRLIADGFELADLKRAVAEDRLVLLPVDRVSAAATPPRRCRRRPGCRRRR